MSSVCALGCDDVTPSRTHTDPQAEINKLPAPLRERFDTRAGRAEMDRALEDKQLLIEEARRRGLHQSEAVRHQVQTLEDRLAVQALLQDEKAAPATDDELRAFYESERDRFAQPERVQVRRLFVAARGDEVAAKKKAASLAARVDKGEDFAVVVKDSDGPERVRGGDYGAVAADDEDRGLAAAAFALVPGKHSGVVATRGGFSVLFCDRRMPARTPPFEEVRADVANRYQPTLERRGFEQLLKKLRAAEAAKAKP